MAGPECARAARRPLPGIGPAPVAIGMRDGSGQEKGGHGRDGQEDERLHLPVHERRLAASLHSSIMPEPPEGSFVHKICAAQPWGARHAANGQSCTRRNRNAFRITDTELNVIAALAQIGLISTPIIG